MSPPSRPVSFRSFRSPLLFILRVSLERERKGGEREREKNLIKFRRIYVFFFFVELESGGSELGFSTVRRLEIS